MPSSSARCAQFPRAQDKVHFYIKLRELRDQLKGQAKAKEVEEVSYSFDLGLAKGKGVGLEVSVACSVSGHVLMTDCLYANRGRQEDGRQRGAV